MVRIFIYLLIKEKDKNKDNEIPKHLTIYIYIYMNTLKSVNPVEVIKASNMSDSDYAEATSLCEVNSYGNDSYATLPTNWNINLACI